jgi:hypothetical protein
MRPQFAADYLNASSGQSPKALSTALVDLAEFYLHASRSKLSKNEREALKATLVARGKVRFRTLRTLLSIFGLNLQIVPINNAKQSRRQGIRQAATRPAKPRARRKRA